MVSPIVIAPPEPGSSGALSEGVFRRAHRLIGRLVTLYGGLGGVATAFMALTLWPFATVPRVAVLAREAAFGGLGAIVLPALLLTLTGLVATQLLTAARQRPAFAERFRAADIDAPEPRDAGSAAFAARIGQAIALPAGLVLIGLSAWLLWPAGGQEVASGDAELLAAFVFGGAFVSVVAERVLSAVAAPQLAEAPGLRRLLLLTTVLLAIAGCLEIGRGAGLGWVRWIVDIAAAAPCLVGAELALRAAARVFLPAPANARAVAATQSVLADLLTGGPRAPGALIRTHLGVDFARSWALAYLSAAILPAFLLTALLCWGLSGLKLVELDQRGVYERLGAPAAVLGPGLHLLLPWPLGRLRPVELGTIHGIAVGSDAPPEAGEQIGAEAIPPASADRLWTTAHATEVNYLVASSGGPAQSFQLVSTEILVLFRTGLSDRDALQAVYGAADRDAVVRQAAGRLATRYFGRRSLDAVMGDQPQTLADALRRDLATEVARAQAGIEIVAVVIEEIHPPAGAAAAYHRVQAAEIDANASISDEIGRATRMMGVAQQEAHQMTDAATAVAAETMATANAAAYRFGKDRLAAAHGPQAFLLERDLADLAAALAQVKLTIVDHRLTGMGGTVLDLRPAPPGGDVTALPQPLAGPASLDQEGAGKPDEVQAGTFTYVPPGSTADTAAPTPDAAPDASSEGTP